MNPVSEFEKSFSRLVGAEYSVAVNSGTSALHAALVACDVKGGEVIMPALCPAMDAFAIIHAGATPVYADVEPQTGLITADTLRPHITGRTRAVIVVHLHGLSCDLGPVMAVARDHGLKVIEDCAQALLATYCGNHVGTIGDLGCFSFEKKKHMTTGSEGGMITSNDAALITSARKFAGIGYKHMTAALGRTSLSAATYQRPDYERFDTIGLNYRMSEIQAAAGLSALPTVKDNVRRRRDIGMLWQDAWGRQAQPHSYDAENVFYSAAFPYDGDWLELYNKFTELGGDGFYAMPQIPYQEPALRNTNREGRLWFAWTAEKLQQRLVLHKTHYPSTTMAALQASLMKEALHCVS